MKIFFIKYKNISAVKVYTERYTAVFLPSEGGKMASFKDNLDGKEYLVQNASKDYLTLGENGDYVASECSGFDDMFPTIDQTTVYRDGEKVVYPDHGEICRLQFDYKVEKEKLIMQTQSDKLGYSYKKIVYEEENGFIGIKYEIVNISNIPLDALWAGHCLINAEKGGKLIVPFANDEKLDLIFDTTSRFGKNGDRISLTEEHLSHGWQDGKPECRKYYFAEKCRMGKVAYEYPNGKRFIMNFDKNELCYLGLWLNYGDINGYYCIGLEPCTLGYDSVEKAKNYYQTKIIEANGKLTFYISVGVR